MKTKLKTSPTEKKLYQEIDHTKRGKNLEKTYKNKIFIQVQAFQHKFI